MKTDSIAGSSKCYSTPQYIMLRRVVKAIIKTGQVMNPISKFQIIS